jgi:hypothetical protein
MTPTDRNILRGQNRNNVIELAKKLNIPVEIKDLQPWHLYNCDEAFLSTTSPGPLQPIGRFNGILIGKELPAPTTKRLAEAWSEWVGIDVTGWSRLSEEERAAAEKERSRLNEERDTSGAHPLLVVLADFGSVLPQAAIKGNENGPYNLALPPFPPW